jgi:hypothetical protein
VTELPPVGVDLLGVAAYRIDGAVPLRYDAAFLARAPLAGVDRHTILLTSGRDVRTGREWAFHGVGKSLIIGA